MKYLKVILISLIVVVAVVFGYLLFSTSSTSQNNLDNPTFDELFSTNDVPNTISEEAALSDTVDIGELFN